MFFEITSWNRIVDKEFVFCLPINQEKSMQEIPNQGQPNLLLTIVRMPMPFGKYKGTLLCNLPVHYLEWFNREGFPEGKLGVLLSTVLEIKSNGLEYLLEPLKQKG